MADVTHMGIDEVDAIQGFLEGFTFRRAGAELGVTPFGMSIKILPGPDGIRLLAIGGVPGQAYDPRSTV